MPFDRLRAHPSTGARAHLTAQGRLASGAPERSGLPRKAQGTLTKGSEQSYASCRMIFSSRNVKIKTLYV
jgi:hypothetical protein